MAETREAVRARERDGPREIERGRRRREIEGGRRAVKRELMAEEESVPKITPLALSPVWEDERRVRHEREKQAERRERENESRCRGTPPSITPLLAAVHISFR